MRSTCPINCARQQYLSKPKSSMTFFALSPCAVLLLYSSQSCAIGLPQLMTTDWYYHCFYPCPLTQAFSSLFQSRKFYKDNIFSQYIHDFLKLLAVRKFSPYLKLSTIKICSILTKLKSRTLEECFT